MQVAAKMEKIDLELQRLQEILLEEQKLWLIYNTPGLPSLATSAQNEGIDSLQLNAALSRAAELEHTAAQSKLMTQAAMGALRESQMEVLQLREELQAQRLHTERAADISIPNVELQKEVDLLNSAMAKLKREAETLHASLTAKDAELQIALSRCNELETAAAYVAPAEVSRLTLQLRMRDETMSEESRRSDHLLASMEQSLAEAKNQLTDALHANLSLNTEWKARHDRTCNEYMETINALQETIQQNSNLSLVSTERDQLRVPHDGSSDDVSALNLQVSRLLHANALLEKQLDALTLSPPAPVHSAASQLQGSVERARGMHMYALEVHALKRELADVRARANSVEPKDNGQSRATPAFFISERQYSLLVEENAQLLQTNAQLEQHVATLKEQLRSSIRSRHQRDSKADEISHAALDTLYEFCVGLGQRLDSIELAVKQQLQSNDQ